VTQALDRSGETWPRAGFLRHAAAFADLNLLAYALVAAERRNRAAEVFGVLAGRVTKLSWEFGGGPVDAFAYAQSRSLRRADQGRDGRP
jgi:hypothetical protein